MQNSITILLNTNEQNKAKEILFTNGWIEVVDSNQYVNYRFKSPQGSSVTLYTSGKLLFQGREDFNSLMKDIRGGDVEDIKSHIGVDEVGKGDYFGPLVVVACFTDMEFARKTKLLGFGDSKKITDSKILKLFNNIKEYPYYYSNIVYPKEYNRLVSEYGNVSVLLAKQHSLVIEKGLEDLKSKGIKCEYVVVDQFSSSKSRVLNELGVLAREIEFRQFHKGESDIAVAIASVIARAIFLNELESMSSKYDFQFPKGASNVIESAREFLSIYGKEKLELVAKTSFKTTKSVIQSF